MQEAQIERHVAAVTQDGFTILEKVFAQDRATAFRRRIRAIERDTLHPLEPGETEEDSSFFRTTGLLRLDPLFWDVPIDPSVTAVVEGVLGADFLLSTFSGIDLKPTCNTIQPLHPDDALVPVPRPHERPIGCTAMWVVTDFNEHTGGTRLLPGSHREPLDLLWSQDDERLSKAIQPDLKPGSVLLFDHALFHGAADNRSDEQRLGLQVSYHAGWIRPYTNWFRSIPIEEVRRFPERLRDLLGYKTYNGIGSANFNPGSYRESYTGKGRPRLARLSLD
ncbi:MAG: phytanoyl-CoA dioxygenase family protein [Deltaproteobacteria bacterium]|nr:phytanoyl-CoA dioxygenase family protein [Deltaproteobacteria bacterium]